MTSGNRALASRGIAEGRTVDGRNLPLAVAVGVGLAIIFLGTLFWHTLAFATFVVALTALAYLEAANVLRKVERRLVTPVAVAATIVMFAGAYVAGVAGQLVGVATLLLEGDVFVEQFDEACLTNPENCANYLR
jgi:phosphatidate cytidylyltransferase